MYRISVSRFPFQCLHFYASLRVFQFLLLIFINQVIAIEHLSLSTDMWVCVCVVIIGGWWGDRWWEVAAELLIFARKIDWKFIS